MELTEDYVLGLLKKTETALVSVEIVEEGGQRVLDMATRYLEDAIHFFEKGDLEKAMAAEEYSHGLLDGGVGTGALRVIQNEDLFVF
ncbi:MAG: DUF357 domain-containing protein [archaeon]